MSDYVPTKTLTKGAKGKDVERLQQYLAQFGYLNLEAEPPAVDRFGIATIPEIESVTPVPKGDFNGGVTVALKEFQSFNGLPVTGELDKVTLDLMKHPRCGFPDMVEYANSGRKWSKSTLTYGFKEFTPNLTQNEIIVAIEQAFALWSAVIPLSFRRVAMTANPDIVIRFVTGDHGDGNAFDGVGNVLAHAYYPSSTTPGDPIQGDTHFDDAETWSISIPPKAGATDLVSVAAHEFGHALGLGHSTVKDALMYPYYVGPHRFLHSDDISGITAIYGFPKIDHAIWVHGTSIEVEYPNNIESIHRAGSYTRIIGKANTTNWFHFSIPTPVIINNDRKVIGTVMLRFRTGSNKAIVRDVHIYDGEMCLIRHNGLDLSGDHLFERFGVPHLPEARYGLGISIGVEFATGTAEQRHMDFMTAGCDFRA